MGVCLSNSRYVVLTCHYLLATSRFLWTNQGFSYHLWVWGLPSQWALMTLQQHRSAASPVEVWRRISSLRRTVTKNGVPSTWSHLTKPLPFCYSQPMWEEQRDKGEDIIHRGAAGNSFQHYASFILQPLSELHLFPHRWDRTHITSSAETGCTSPSSGQTGHTSPP